MCFHYKLPITQNFRSCRWSRVCLPHTVMHNKYLNRVKDCTYYYITISMRVYLGLSGVSKMDWFPDLTQQSQLSNLNYSINSFQPYKKHQALPFPTLHVCLLVSQSPTMHNFNMEQSNCTRLHILVILELVALDISVNSPDKQVGAQISNSTT